MGRDQLLASLRTRISDERVLDAVAQVPRELFIAPVLERFAYADRPLPIGGGQTISQPTLVARMVELLELSADDVVLDVGSGSGYHAALLSRLCRHVYGVELDEELAAQAARSLELAGIDNVTIVAGDGAAGLPEHAPFQAINVAATASEELPAALLQQLAVGGRLIAPVASGEKEHLVLVRRTPQGLERTVLDAVRFVPLR
ncbi:MAG: protein-L-isoaspartate(D-aspartate) O-methyltransferase [Actinomycetota bacterium]|nr:protein-L-isoaspartate(D-aspartate) O-methyltransferase [Actinomycetota bacterium]MDP8968196.1 protein-L-isoaspartate(D-aspartate) O-methyltransferase [Actinomycetota bacterium]